ncbi:hypothetical protein KBZ21_50525, partial [Streptomyces sp. A73]|nr:hypothetical protein [Streptomyces sp. A73]
YTALTTTAKPSEPLWRSWAARLWRAMMRRLPPAPAPLPPRPNSAKIERLERELGIGDPAPEPPTTPFREGLKR